VTDRLLVIFARAPAAQAREKGLPRGAASDLFAAMAREWRRVAAGSRARVAIAAPPEDRTAWRRALADTPDLLWISQCGDSFGDRLERVALDAGALAHHVVVTGGDVAPSGRALTAAFDALESGAAAVLAPAADGGVSLIALPRDPDLLRSIGPRRRDLFRWLRRRLSARARRVAVVDVLPDLDGPRGLRPFAAADGLAALVSLVRQACRSPRPDPRPTPRSLRPALPTRPSRGPPLAA
jgi:glycosyltransferase A (GT-A) superfamily protein (DUF2064 family)